jgi:hypothetical protein
LHISFVYEINDYMMKATSRFRGPSLILLAIAHILLVATGLVVSSMLHHGAPFVTPFASGEAVRQFFAGNPEAVKISSFFLFGSAIPLGIFSVTLVSRLRHLGVRAAGTNIALLGGISACVALAFSGMASWMLSVPEAAASIAVIKVIVFFAFLSGGVWFAVGFGLLAAGTSVTCYFTQLFPKWLVAVGIVVALAGELSWFSLIAYPANFFIPVTRFVGFLWMVGAAIALRRDRRLVRATWEAAGQGSQP